jgi:hypothetical protein
MSFAGAVCGLDRKESRARTNTEARALIFILDRIDNEP